MTFNKLTEKEEYIIDHKGTEAPFSGEYDNFTANGTFICRKCNSPLFSAQSKFNANCGWPSFDENFPNAVTRIQDQDGIRTEIRCSNCAAHLGHVFTGEHITEKNTRHCVNSLSIKFIPDGKELPKILNEN